MSGVRIREYAEGDWPAVVAILGEVVEAAETYALAPMTDQQARDFWLTQPGVVVIAEVDGEVLGTAKLGPNRPAQGSHVGTASFLVAAAARGRGIGRALGEYAVQWHRDQGFRGIQFNAVVETNLAAVRLWRDLGFEIVGTVPGAFRRPSGEYVGLHVMWLDLQ